MTKQYQEPSQDVSLKTGLYQISFYVPVENCEAVKRTMFDAGAGIVGEYKDCAWQTIGEGQFKPLEGSKPYLGKVDKLKKVEEFKVEMVCDQLNIDAVVQALKSSHPYEVPAFSVIKLEPF